MSTAWHTDVGARPEIAELSPADLPTPALVVDRRILNVNIDSMAEHASRLSAVLWPHAKTHKSSEIARAQVAAGAAGITVATVAEAETMVAAGVRDILLAYPPVDRWRLERITGLAATARITVGVDDVDTVLQLDQACLEAGVEVGYLWEIDCGNHRCGSEPGEPTADLVAEAIARARCCPYTGLMTFPGHAYASRDDAELREIAAHEVKAITATVRALERRRIASRVLSIGSTPTVRRHESGVAGMQLRPGNYVFNDATQVALGVALVEACALTVLTTVISRPAPDRLILDAGSKALSSDGMTNRTRGFGIVSGRPNIVIQRLYEEHAIAAVEDGERVDIGTRLRVIPNHACTTVNLHASALVIEDGAPVDVWSVSARGWG